MRVTANLESGLDDDIDVAFDDLDAPELDGSASLFRQRVGVTHVYPWSVAKVAVIFWAAVGICVMGAVFFTWALLSMSGAISNFEHFMTDLTGLKHFQVMSAPVLFGIALLCAIATIVSIALTVLGAVFYNALASLTGGVEVDLTS
jgi:hypothetical protein